MMVNLAMMSARRSYMGHNLNTVCTNMTLNYVQSVELSSENETFEKPNWLGEEVTNDERYYNAYLSQNPFKNW